MELLEKIAILAGAAKYDASCASSGGVRKNLGKGLGNSTSAAMGICHSWTSDGRCVSLLKVLFSNYCINDCAYCHNRRGNDIPRAAFTVEELVDLTINFYRRNYIEGLFLSSGIIKNADYTMERLIQVVRKLREEQRFNGYIHLKVIPGTAGELIRSAGRYADRLSVNIELPSEQGLRRLAPDKKKDDILKPMALIETEIKSNAEERKRFRHPPLFVPAGQSTQLIVGASPEPDFQILRMVEHLYQRVRLRRVYYSAYIPVNDHALLPMLTAPPVQREHRLYQADWLLRFYHFRAEEIVSPAHPLLDADLDPKTSWALRHSDFFPLEINRADYEALLRIPGVGLKSAQRIIASRKFNALTFDDLPKLGVVLKRARYFITCRGKVLEQWTDPAKLRQSLLAETLPKRSPVDSWRQLALFK